MSTAERSRISSTLLAESSTSPSLPSLPNWLTISATTPAACGEAIDVPWMQPYAPAGSVERIVVRQSPVVPFPPGAETSFAGTP
jgi:hypothetical protein